MNNRRNKSKKKNQNENIPKYKPKGVTAFQFPMYVYIAAIIFTISLVIAILNYETILNKTYNYNEGILSIIVGLLTGIAVSYVYARRVDVKNAAIWYESLSIEILGLTFVLNHIEEYTAVQVGEKINKLETFLIPYCYKNAKYLKTSNRSHLVNLITLVKLVHQVEKTPELASEYYKKLNACNKDIMNSIRDKII